MRPLPVWRSLLYVPVNVERFVAKAHTRGADALILDLEDSIAPDGKEAARSMVPAAAERVRCGGADVLVRINRPWRQAVSDLESSICAGVDGIVIPKCSGPDHVRLVDEVISELEDERDLLQGKTRIMPMIESASALLRISAIASASDRVVAITVGSEDFSAELGMVPDGDSLYAPNVHAVIAANAAGVLPLGYAGSIADFADVAHFRDIAERSRRLGFRGGSAVHPNQVAVLNKVHAAPRGT